MKSKHETKGIILGNIHCFAFLCIVFFVIGCKKSSTNDNTGKADMEFVSEQIESDGYKWYRYQKNYGTDSIETAIVDMSGNYLSRLFSIVSYGCNFGDYSSTGFETAIRIEDPVSGEYIYGHGYVDENYEEKLIPEYGCSYGTKRIGVQYFEYDAPSMFYIETTRRQLYKESKSYVHGCYDKEWNLILMPIYDLLVYSVGGNFLRDDNIEERFCVQYNGLWYATNMKLDSSGLREEARHPEKKGFYRCSFSNRLKDDYSWKGELLYFNDYICISKGIPGNSDYNVIYRYNLTDNNSGIRKYKISEKTYYEYDGDDFFYVTDYYDDDNHVFTRAKLYEIESNAYSLLSKYEEAYRMYFSEINKQISQNGFMHSEDIYKLHLSMIPGVQPHRGSMSNGTDNSSMPLYPTQSMNPNIYDSNDGSYGGNISNGGSQSQQQHQRTWRECSHCHGKGTVVRDSYTATYGNDHQVYCSECGRSYYASSGHSHVTCPICHGDKGFWSE